MKLIQSYFIASPIPGPAQEYVDGKGRLVRISEPIFHGYHEEPGNWVEVFEKEGEKEGDSQ